MRYSPNTYTSMLGRVMDLQPAIDDDDDKVVGVKLMFRLSESRPDGSVVQHVDRRVHTLDLGPFDTVIQVTNTAKVKVDKDVEDVIEFPVGNGENTYSLIQENRHRGQENRFLTIRFQMES